MARKPSSHRTAWDKTILKQLKSMAGNAPVSAIARTLKRTESAVRKRATDIGLSLRVIKAGKARKKAAPRRKTARKAR